MIEGPLAPFAAMLVEHLDAQGYGTETVIRKIRLIGKLSRFLQETGRVVKDLGMAATLTEFVDTVHFPRSDRVTATTLTWVIELLVERGEIEPALPSSHDVDGVLGRYRHYLKVERGLVPKTAASYERVAQLFLLEHPEGELREPEPSRSRSLRHERVPTSRQRSRSGANGDRAPVASYLRACWKD